MRKLTVLVTCTERKRLTPSTERQVRSLPAGTVADRADIWIDRLSQPVDKLPLMDLYKGEAWQQVKALVHTAHRVGYMPDVVVASAGLGLRPGASMAGAYAATFAYGHADSVAADSDTARTWWTRLATAPEALPSDSPLLRGRVLVVASAAYARAMTPTLHQLAESASAALFVGGGCDIPGLTRLPPNKALRVALGGTASSLNLRMARQWLELSGGRDLCSAQTQREWGRWCARVQREESYDRRRLSDEEIRRFIAQVVRADPAASMSTTLRALRDSGFACEQSRFRKLFEGQVVTP
jgi:hypothetical protein